METMLTPEERLEIYRQTLDLIKRSGLRYGLCYAMTRIFCKIKMCEWGSEEANRFYDESSRFSEMVDIKLNTDNAYWWVEGQAAPRIAALEKMIELVKAKLLTPQP